MCGSINRHCSSVTSLGYVWVLMYHYTHPTTPYGTVTQSPDEITEIFQTIEEILSQRKIALTKMDFEAETSDGNWKTFVSKTIREQRRAAGITQAELAEKSGLLQSHISRLENGQYSATRITLVKIAKALGIPLSKLDPSAGSA